MQIHTTGLDDINRALQELDDKTGNIRPLVNELGNHIYNVIERSFETQTSPDGTPWSPIKKATHKNHKLGTGKILFRTGHMQNSLYNYSVIGGGAYVGVNATSKGYAYPLVHQFGTKDGKIEARRFMPIKLNGDLYDKTEKELGEIVEDYFEFLAK